MRINWAEDSDYLLAEVPEENCIGEKAKLGDYVPENAAEFMRPPAKSTGKECFF